MGTCFDLVCKQCKKRVDLNKNRSFPSLFLSEVLKEPSIQNQSWWDLAVPVVFMRRHWGHDLKLTNDCLDEYGDDIADSKEEDLFREKALED